MSFNPTAVPFLTLFIFGVIAIALSLLFRALVERRMTVARQKYDALENDARSRSPEPFWLRYGETVKRSIQTVAWTIVGLAVLNLFSFALIELAEKIVSPRDDTALARFADDLRRLSLWMKQGADVLLRVVIIAVVGVWVARFLHGAVRGLLNSGINSTPAHQAHYRGRVRTETLLTTAGYVINVGLFVVGLLMCLQLIGISVAPLLATAGVASVAIGFGAQSLVRDMLAGFFILFEDQFAVGDVITVDGRSGTVENLTLRCTKMRLSDGSLLVVPNGEIKRIENLTSGFSQIDYRISVMFGPQVDRARELLTQQVMFVAANSSHDVLADPEVLGVDSIKDSSVVLRAKIKTKPGRQFALERELNQRVLDAFVQAQIMLPSNK